MKKRSVVSCFGRRKPCQVDVRWNNNESPKCEHDFIFIYSPVFSVCKHFLSSQHTYPPPHFLPAKWPPLILWTHRKIKRSKPLKEIDHSTFFYPDLCFIICMKEEEFAIAQKAIKAELQQFNINLEY